VSSAQPIHLAPGAIFGGDFRVVRPLSEGGMGAVYVVEQLSTGNPRALKLMLPNLVADARSRQRFEQEARVGARIESEHIVQVVAAGVDAQTGLPWLAMELLQGEDLSHRVRRAGPLSLDAVSDLLEQLCHAIGAAHAAGIVHRDLKPENIFLASSRRAGSDTMVKVLGVDDACRAAAGDRARPDRARVDTGRRSRARRCVAAGLRLMVSADGEPGSGVPIRERRRCPAGFRQRGKWGTGAGARVGPGSQGQ
jgi:serine/threonine protein kinase